MGSPKSKSGSLNAFPDGLEVLRSELPLADVMRLIERTARWADPETFRLLPVWYPEFSRRAFFYKANWTEPQHNRNRQTGLSVHKQEGNRYANQALTHALGLRKHERRNWSCCHIWGVDDPSFQQENDVVQDARYFSCVANMVLLPTPLKAFTDSMGEVKAMLRVCAANLYGWSCGHESVAEVAKQISAWSDWSAYPASWPRTPGDPLPLGVVPINDRIRRDANRRLAAIRDDLATAGPFYPREAVRQALDYWGIQL